MARQQPTESRPVDVNSMIETALEVTGYMLRTAEIDASLELTPLLQPVLAAGDQLNQVMTTLAVNAHRALAGAPRPHQPRRLPLTHRPRHEDMPRYSDTATRRPRTEDHR